MPKRIRENPNRIVFISEAGRICGISGPTFDKLATETGIKPAGTRGELKRRYWYLKDVLALKDRIEKHRSPGLPILLK